ENNSLTNGFYCPNERNRFIHGINKSDKNHQSTSLSLYLIFISHIDFASTPNIYSYCFAQGSHNGNIHIDYHLAARI
ncbi:hypothetical protein, partial [uncultured Cycloclasticus sp.]|uniref:hypothetical protein n=1 Tax=uncultured Cycloclasticus sp. TaxID=172194 RepID=UPI002587B6A4